MLNETGFSVDSQSVSSGSLTAEVCLAQRKSTVENVLLTLSEVRHWYNTRLVTGPSLTVVRGQPLPGARFETVVPVDGAGDFSPKQLRELIANCATANDADSAEKSCADINDREALRRDQIESPASLVLAVSAADSTCVYYRLHQGLVPPQPLRVSQEKRQARDDIFTNRKKSRLNAAAMLDEERKKRADVKDSPVEN